MAPPSSDWNTEEGQWVLLVCIPHVVSDTVLPPPTGLSVQREHPPRPFRLTVPCRVAPDPKSIYNHPYVSSAGDFGRFVLYASHGTQPEPPFVDDFDTDAEPEDRFDYMDYPKELFLCDLNTRTATLLPRPDPDPERPRPIVNPGSVGLLATSATKSIILHLQTSPVSNLATLLCYTSDDNRWTVQNLFYPLGARQRRWKGGDGVIKYMDLMIWVDLSCGILTLDTNLLLEGRPELRYVPLPQECQRQAEGLARERCFGVSAGKVRFLEISNYYETIRLWTLVDMGTGDWTLDHQLDLENLRDEDGFKAMGLELPNECPGVAFIHPEHPTMAYFFQESRLFHVDMSTGKFMDGQYFMMDNPPADYHSSRFVRPWKLPQQLFSGIVNLSNGPIRRAKDKAQPGVTHRRDIPGRYSSAELEEHEAASVMANISPRWI